MISNEKSEDFYKTDDSLLPDIHIEMLSKRDEAFLTNFGIGGLLLSAACIIQIFAQFNEVDWLLVVTLLTFLLLTTTYVLMLRRSQWFAPGLLIGSFLALLLQVVYVFERIKSLALLMLVIFSIIAAALLYAAFIPQKLAMKASSDREEADQWNKRYSKRR